MADISEKSDFSKGFQNSQLRTYLVTWSYGSGGGGAIVHAVDRVDAIAQANAGPAGPIIGDVFVAELTDPRESAGGTVFPVRLV